MTEAPVAETAPIDAVITWVDGADLTHSRERVNKEIKRRTNVVGIFPNHEVVIRLFGELVLAPNDERAVSRGYMPVEELISICNATEVATMIAAQ